MQLAVAVLNIGPAMAEEQVIVTVLSWLLSFRMVWCWKNVLRNLLLKCSGKAEPQPSNSAFKVINFHLDSRNGGNKFL
jgi:hypothetical protein